MASSTAWACSAGSPSPKAGFTATKAARSSHATPTLMVCFTAAAAVVPGAAAVVAGAAAVVAGAAAVVAGAAVVAAAAVVAGAAVVAAVPPPLLPHDAATSKPLVATPSSATLRARRPMGPSPLLPLPNPGLRARVYSSSWCRKQRAVSDGGRDDPSARPCRRRPGLPRVSALARWPAL